MNKLNQTKHYGRLWIRVGGNVTAVKEGKQPGWSFKVMIQSNGHFLSLKMSEYPANLM